MGKRGHTSRSWTCYSEGHRIEWFVLFRKPTFTGLYTRWDLFCPMKHKTNLVRSLTNRAIKICSASTLDNERDHLRDIFRKNGYPSSVVESVMTSVLKPRGKVTENVQLQPVVLRLPWIGDVSNRLPELRHSKKTGRVLYHQTCL